jgi:hypothetical protein
VTEAKLPLSNRSHNSIVDDDGEHTVAVRDLCDLFGVDALIRVHQQDYALIDQLPDKYVHFNLERTLNEEGKRYAILPIVKPGFRTKNNEEILPVLDPRRHRIGRCDAILQQVPIEQVRAEHFQYSISTIRTIDELKKAMLARYAPMFPALTSDQLLSRGCAISRIHFLPTQTALPSCSYTSRALIVPSSALISASNSPLE